MRNRFLLIIILFFLLIGCETPNRAPRDLVVLQTLNSSSTGVRGKVVKISRIRLMAIQDIATGVGARAGLAWRSNQINCILDGQDKILWQTYNFQRVMLNHDVLPPVLMEGQYTLNLADPTTIRLAQRVYKIETQAHFVTTPPHWRDYLWMSYPDPDPPDRSLLPKTHAEREVWAHFITIGWDQGVRQANDIFAANLARIKRDYTGMVLYRKLYAAHMVSAPFVSKTELGITGNGNMMRIDDKVLRITALPQLNLNGNSWKATITPGDPVVIPGDRDPTYSVMDNNRQDPAVTTK